MRDLSRRWAWSDVLVVGLVLYVIVLRTPVRTQNPNFIHLGGLAAATCTACSSRRCTASTERTGRRKSASGRRRLPSSSAEATTSGSGRWGCARRRALCGPRSAAGDPERASPARPTTRSRRYPPARHPSRRPGPAAAATPVIRYPAQQGRHAGVPPSRDANHPSESGSRLSTLGGPEPSPEQPLAQRRCAPGSLGAPGPYRSDR